jgi:alkylhydroperoxidase family enzyme
LSALYEDIRALRGSILNLYRVLANHPPALRAFMAMSHHVRDESTLPPQLRELAILVTAHALDVEYEKVHHLPAARRAGIPESKLQAVPRWATSPVYDPRERAVMAYADQVARTRRVSDSAFEALRQHLTPAQIVDLAVTVGWYHFCAAIILPLEVETEHPGFTP